MGYNFILGELFDVPFVYFGILWFTLETKNTAPSTPQ
jgi:hypothetical protein